MAGNEFHYRVRRECSQHIRLRINRSQSRPVDVHHIIEFPHYIIEFPVLEKERNAAT